MRLSSPCLSMWHTPSNVPHAQAGAAEPQPYRLLRVGATAATALHDTHPSARSAAYQCKRHGQQHPPWPPITAASMIAVGRPSQQHQLSFAMDGLCVQLEASSHVRFGACRGSPMTLGHPTSRVRSIAVCSDQTEIGFVAGIRELLLPAFAELRSV